MDSFKNDKTFLEEASRFMAEDAHLTENDGMKLVLKLSAALKGYEDFRADIKKVVDDKYPKQQKNFIKAFKGVDKEMVKLEAFIKGL
jgi:hypothetical protein